jgi:hypothetical protein
MPQPMWDVISESSGNFRQPLLKGVRFTAYTEHVAACPRLALIGLAALVCLPGMLRGDDGSRDYVIHLSGSTPPAKLELSVTPASAEWEVTAVYDAARCEIHCTWRRKEDALGSRRLVSLLPPIAVIRMYSNFAATPDSVTIDPAGLGLPGVTRDLPLRQEAIFMPARKLCVAIPAQADGHGAVERPRAQFLSSDEQPDVTASSTLPLRI